MNDQETKVWFGKQVEDCMDALYGFAYRLTRNGTDAEDLVAESVAKAWGAIEKLNDRGMFKSWMFRILHNCYVSDYRKKKIRPTEVSYNATQTDGGEDSFPDFLMQMSDDFLLWWGTPEKEFANKVLHDDILAAIEDLPETYKTVILLVTVEGLSYTDAADVLDVPTGTVHSRMKRGRTLLQQALWHHASDAGLVAEPQTEGCAL